MAVNADEPPSPRMTGDPISSVPGLGAVWGVLVAWFIAALFVGYLELLRGAPFWLPPLIPITATVFFAVLFIRIAALRRAVLAVDMSWLVSIGFVRSLSFYMGYLSLKGEIAASLAVPIEIGVALIVVTAALLIAYCRPLESRGRRWLIIWNVAGALQILSILGTVIWHIVIGQPPRFFASLPFNLFPTFFVPLSFVGHILIAYRLRGSSGDR